MSLQYLIHLQTSYEEQQKTCIEKKNGKFGFANKPRFPETVNAIDPGTRWFTLIELLITIAIIAILAAMILPALQKAKEKGKAIDCISSQKQLGTAILMYSSGNNDFMPMPYNYDSSSKAYTIYNTWWNSNLTWTACLLPYINGNVYSLKTMSLPGVFRCKSEETTVKGSNDSYTTQMNGSSTTNYGYTRLVGPLRPSWNGNFRPRKLSRAKRPTLSAILADQDPNCVGYYGNLSSVSQIDKDLAARHGGRTNILFADSHVGTMSPIQAANEKVIDGKFGIFEWQDYW